MLTGSRHVATKSPTCTQPKLSICCINSNTRGAGAPWLLISSCEPKHHGPKASSEAMTRFRHEKMVGKIWQNMGENDGKLWENDREIWETNRKIA